MNKKLFLFGGIAACFIVAVAWLLLRANAPILGDNIELVAFTSQNKPTGVAFIRIPYVRNIDQAGKLDIDINLASNSEQKMPNVAARIKTDHFQKLYFTLDPTLVNATSKNVTVSLTVNNKQEVKTKSVTIQKLELVDLVELDKVTRPNDSMKGDGLTPQPGLSDKYKSDAPDLKQRKDECAPTAAANGLIGLASEHNMIGNLPATPTDLIDALKGEMNWTPADGVLTQNFVAGKNTLSAKLGLPITTTQVGGQNGEDTLGKIMDGLQAGGAAELRLKFVDPKTNRVRGGHLVTVTNVYSQDGHDFIDIHDPMSTEGTDTYEVRGNKLLNYGLAHGKDAYVGLGFVQTWTGTLTGGTMEPLTPGELQGLKPYMAPRKIKVISVQGHDVPLSEVYVGTGPDCDAPHYHASRGTVVALDGTKIVDPEGCGFGRVRDVPVKEVDAK